MSEHTKNKRRRHTVEIGRIVALTPLLTSKLFGFSLVIQFMPIMYYYVLSGLQSFASTFYFTVVRLFIDL